MHHARLSTDQNASYILSTADQDATGQFVVSLCGDECTALETDSGEGGTAGLVVSRWGAEGGAVVEGGAEVGAEGGGEVEGGPDGSDRARAPLKLLVAGHRKVCAAYALSKAGANKIARCPTR